MPIKTRFNNEDFYLYPVLRDGEGFYCTFALGEPNDDEMMRPYVKRQDGKAALYTDMESLYANHGKRTSMSW